MREKTDRGVCRVAPQLKIIPTHQTVDHIKLNLTWLVGLRNSAWGFKSPKIRFKVKIKSI